MLEAGPGISGKQEQAQNSDNQRKAFWPTPVTVRGIRRKYFAPLMYG